MLQQFLQHIRDLDQSMAPHLKITIVIDAPEMPLATARRLLNQVKPTWRHKLEIRAKRDEDE